MLGSRISFLRRGLGMSQAELARELNISASALGMYEQERRNPPQDVLVALSRKLHVSIDYLLTGQAAMPVDSQILANLLKERNMNGAEPVMCWREGELLIIAVRLED